MPIGWSGTGNVFTTLRSDARSTDTVFDVVVDDVERPAVGGDRHAARLAAGGRARDDLAGRGVDRDDWFVAVQA